ncbi:MAG TPA: hypothetical protein VNS09_16520 [Solirubrobacter sp.]|nr:hypothetical protein [Solirubrobacter sp.]
MSDYRASAERGQNWAAFAAVLFLILGIFNVVDGIAALAADDHFRAEELLFGDLTLWGVLFLIVGIVQLLTSYLIFQGSAAGALLGVTLASLNAVLALLAIGAYPIWAIIILVLDGVVIYALTVYGDALRSPR